MVRRNSAALLAILLGSFGIHKFYLGEVFLGVLYLLFFWTYIPTIIGIIEGIYYCSLSEDEFRQKFNIPTVQNKVSQYLANNSSENAALKQNNQKLNYLEQTIQKLERELQTLKSKNRELSSIIISQQDSIAGIKEAQSQIFTQISVQTSFQPPAQPKNIFDHSIENYSARTVVTAFSNKDETFFTERGMVLLTPIPKKERTQNSKADLRQVLGLSKAAFISVQVNQEHFVVPNFLSPHYKDLESLYSGTKMFKVYGSGEELILKKPAKVQQIDDHSWRIQESGLYFGKNAEFEMLVEAFNEKNQAFFDSAYPVTISHHTLSTQINKDEVIQFDQVETHRDAEFMIIKFDKKCFLVPDFLSPYYGQLNWLDMGKDIFRHDGQGTLVNLIKPAEVKEEKDGVWKLVKSGNCHLTEGS
ncbi:TM2 domain-containing protein (plasmid) [Picosynechococcus sp. PCC 11901]|uniref:TM2 domain-containing protein n=1 Tax=Picosynechococcus sp. PCC 11901 TaxID=2579791 RepID=UPI0010FC14F0|nr:TM2 domain-containing protein [Picosynechococcus sp. PCC 11901]QCS51006.1 TM2 domain-containing protein [Picosynechococcus sp. PCC 11901]